tara:strand:+ start:1581 stop:1865 length:285 start_codon:yes stop_codon:yes gene_type:complete
MSNIIQIFRVQLLLANCDGQSADRFFDNFEKVAKYRHADREFIYEYEQLEWVFCTHSNHLVCRNDFHDRDQAEEAELIAFDILSQLEYFDREDD